MNKQIKSMSKREQRLKIFRRSLKKTQEEMANKLGWAKNTISSYETAQREPSMEYIMHLANLGMNVHWYYTGNGSISINEQNNERRINPNSVNEAQIVNDVYTLLDDVKHELTSILNPRIFLHKYNSCFEKTNFVLA